MSRTIPSQLLTHKQGTVTTLCRLLRIRTTKGREYGLASLDIDVEYDATGSGGETTLVYKAKRAFEMSNFRATSTTGVDNADVNGLLDNINELGLSVEDIRAGVLDYAAVWIYEVNYNDLNQGHQIKARGKLGKVETDGQLFSAEFRSRTQDMKQGITKFTDTQCRADFGDAQCGKELTWTDNTPMDTPDIDEPDRKFVCAALAGAGVDFYVPGVVEILAGKNVGLEMEVLAYDTDTGAFELEMPAYYPFEENEEFRVRQDCSKRHNDDEHGCIYHWGSEWVLHNRSEHLLPLGKEGELATPGAEL